jgi:hypothetical protein
MFGRSIGGPPEKMLNSYYVDFEVLDESAASPYMLFSQNEKFEKVAAGGILSLG